MSSNKEMGSIEFDMPINQSNVIKVIGVGGGGSNAINHMFSQGINGVDFVICNTDSQALESSSVPIKIQLGITLTEGLGAGANPQVGEQSAVESMEDIKSMLSTNTKMLFITAGMGGGTGTGAAPIIARMAKDMGILTVGIVTIPFAFEGKMRNDQANIGVEKLRDNVDSLIVINNNKLRDVYGNLGFKAGFSKADEVLATAARGIAEVITHHYTQNIDLRDAKTVLSNSGTAIMGSASASGSNRAAEAISKALDSPLLNDNKIKGATNVLLLIVSGVEEITIDEIGEISDYIQSEAGHGANIIMGVGDDDSLEDSIAITVIATGFNVEQQNTIVNAESKKVIHILEDEQKAEHVLVTDKNESLSNPISEPINSVVKTPIIKHTLFEEEEIIEVASSKVPFEDFIETSELIKDLDISFEEIDIHYLAEFKQVNINEIDVNEFVIVDAVSEEEAAEEFTEVERDTVTSEDQILMFDLDINPSSVSSSERKEQPRQLQEIEPVATNIEEIEVSDHIEIAPITEVSKEKTITYSLDDYQEMENHLSKAEPAINEEEIPEEEIVFETRTIEEKEKPSKEENIERDPLNMPISQVLIDQAEKRKRKMKDFNYKFKNRNSHIDEIEKEPAYKRMGIELNENTNQELNISRTSLNIEDDEIDLRTNNSFLHDNVD
ncbi:MAG: cell division protein FtsZ [Flavobacterium sp.]|nr:MAG: cell division protein FtsZ [Flavobacterium sp.]